MLTISKYSLTNFRDCDSIIDASSKFSEYLCNFFAFLYIISTSFFSAGIKFCLDIISDTLRIGCIGVLNS